MTKIEKLHQSHLQNGEHGQFMSDLNTTILKYGANNLGLDSVFPSFQSALQVEQHTMAVEKGSSQSILIEEYDLERDHTWLSIKLRIESAELSPLDDEETSGKVLRRILNKYGDPRRLPLNTESQVLTNLIDDFQKPEQAIHLQITNLSRLVSELKRFNDLVIHVQLERNAELSARPDGNVKATRLVTDQLYLQMVEIVNANLTLGQSTPVTEQFVAELNERITTYSTTLASRKALAKKAKQAAVSTVSKN